MPICPEPGCGLEFDSGRRLAAHKTNAHRPNKKRPGRPRKNRSASTDNGTDMSNIGQSIGAEIGAAIGQQTDQPTDNVTGNETGQTSGPAQPENGASPTDSFIGAAKPDAPSMKAAPHPNPYMRPDGSFNSDYIPPEYGVQRPQMRMQPGAVQGQQQQQQQFEWKDIAAAAVGLGKMYLESRMASRAGPDPFAAIGQAAYQRFLASFSTEVGKATGKGIGMRSIKEGDVSPDAIVEDLVSPQIDNILRNTYDENKRLKERLAQYEGMQTDGSQSDIPADAPQAPSEPQTPTEPPPEPPTGGDKVMHE